MATASSLTGGRLWSQHVVEIDALRRNSATLLLTTTTPRRPLNPPEFKLCERGDGISLSGKAAVCISRSQLFRLFWLQKPALDAGQGHQGRSYLRHLDWHYLVRRAVYCELRDSDSIRCGPFSGIEWTDVFTALSLEPTVDCHSRNSASVPKSLPLFLKTITTSI